MQFPHRRRFVLAIFLIASLTLAFADFSSREAVPGGITLEAPSFVHTAEAAVPPEIVKRLNEEAGISAYFQTSGSITLSQVEGLFSTIETQTGDYIIGSIPVPNYDEQYDAHVYVHTNGWILAYYFNDTPVSKIVDVDAETINTTLLESVVATVAGTAGQAISSASHYDFRYPNATHMIFIAEKSDSGGDEFTVELPSSYGYLERSFAAGGYLPAVYLNGTRSSPMYETQQTEYGFITSGQMAVDTQHTFSVSNSDYGVLVIVYAE